MNIGRGLFRAWILISILWMLGAGITAYAIVAPDTLHGRFQPLVEIKKEVTRQQIDKIDFNGPFDDFGVSPSQLNSAIEFTPDKLSPEDDPNPIMSLFLTEANFTSPPGTTTQTRITLLGNSGISGGVGGLTPLA